MLRSTRMRCPHNFRASRGVCFRCLCETIDDLLENGSDVLKSSNSNSSNTPSASTISEIIYNLRLIQTNLDRNNQKMDAEIEIRSISDTFTGLLKLRNDEIGVVIAQGVQNICPRIASGHREYLMENIFNQLQKSPSLTLGSLECLRVGLLHEEGLTLFLEKFGQDILPKVFQTLRSTTASGCEGRRNSPSEINSQSQNVFGNEFGSSSNRDEKSKILLVIYSIMESTFEVAKKDSCGSLDLVDEYFSNNYSSGVDIFHVFVPYISDIFNDAIAQLKENQPASVVVVGKVLGFLAKLLQHEISLSMLLKSNNLGMALCSALKRMLFGQTNVIQKQTINLLISMFKTYESALEVPGEHQNHIVDLPSMIMQVDLIHGISQVMNTSDPDLFQLILQLLKRWIGIPSFRGKISAVIEAGLRIVSVVINSDSPGIGKIHSFFLRAFENMESVPGSMQNQIISVYSQLPCNWKPIQRLQWAKLLLYCTDSNFLPIIMEFYQRALESFKNDMCSVTCLKVLLAVSQTILNCSSFSTHSESNSNDETISVDTLLLSLMSTKCIPSIKALTTLGNATDSMYITVLLTMLESYPTERLVLPIKYVDELESRERFDVEFESDGEDDILTDRIVTQEIHLFVGGLYCKNGYWTAGAYMKILAWIRGNMGFLTCKRVFDLWNKNVSRIVIEQFPKHLSPLTNVWQRLSRESNTEDSGIFLMYIFDHLELDIFKWVDVMGRNVLQDSEINIDLKFQHEAILVFYYFYFLFNMNDNEELLSPAFIQNLYKLLDHLLQNKQWLLPSELECLSFYFKVSFLIVSCLPECSSDNMVELFETFILDVEEAVPNFQMIVTFCGKVFHLLLRWNVLPMKEVTKLLEKWAREDWEEFRHFFETVDFNDVFNSHLETIKNHAVAVTAYGSIQSSNFIVGIFEKRQIKKRSNFDGGLLQSTLTELIKDILDDSANQMSNKQFNFSNVLQLALGDDPMFCQERTLPSEFFCDIIKILLKYRLVESVVERGLRFLFNFISGVDSPGFIRNICLSSNEFIQFLGKRLSLEEGCPVLNDIAFELMAIIVNNIDTDVDKYNLQDQGIQKFRWSVCPLIQFMEFCFLRIHFLELLCALLRKDFKRSIIMVQEVKMKPEEFIQMLLSIQFHVKSLLHKDMEGNCNVVWKFLYELLCFSERGWSGTRFSTRVLMHPWNHLIISTYVLPESSPFCLPVECLQFLQKWTDHYSKLMISDPRLFSLHYQAFSPVNQFYQLHNFFTSSRDNCKKPVIVNLEQEQDMNFNSSTRGFDSPLECSKTDLVDRIIASCISFLSCVPHEMLNVEDREQEEDIFSIDEQNEHMSSQFSFSSGASSDTWSESEFEWSSNNSPTA